MLALIGLVPEPANATSRLTFDELRVRGGRSECGSATTSPWASPIAEMVKRSKLASSTVKHRFTSATGLTPRAYVQRLRIEDAKRMLERTARQWTRSAGGSDTNSRRFVSPALQSHDRPEPGAY